MFAYTYIYIGFTPLYQAATNGDLTTMKILYKAGADVMLCTNTNVSPLMIACEGGHFETVKWLLEQVISNESIEKCDKMIIHCDNKGQNALMIATLFGYFDIVRYFVAQTHIYKQRPMLVVNIKTKSKQKNTINIAIHYNQTRIVQVLCHNIMKNLNRNSKIQISNGFDHDTYDDNQLQIDENKQKISNCDEFNKRIFNINEALQKAIKYQNNSMLQFLRALMKYYKQNDFQMFQSLFDYENNVSNNVSQKEIENKKFEIEKSNQFCNLFLHYCLKNDEKRFHTIMNGLLNTTVNLMNDRQPISNDMLSLAWKFAVLSSDDNYKLDIKSSSSNRKSRKNSRVVKASAGHKTSQSNVIAVTTTVKRIQDKTKTKTKTNNSGGNINLKNNGTNVDILLNCLKNTISICLSNSNVCKARDYFYYKTFLADANIWFEKLPNNDKANYKAERLVFDEIIEHTVKNEVEKQQKFIYESILAEKWKDPKSWQGIITFQENIISRDKINIRQDTIISKYNSNIDLMKKYGTKAAFKQSKLFVDFENNWDSAQEYDLNCYLTKLLINAHTVNEQFHQDCKNTFTTIFGLHNIKNAQFQGAPVKTAARCKEKSTTGKLFFV